MSALWTALVEGETKESLATMVCEAREQNARLTEDRARFPDRPDDIGRMIEAHLGNLKAGKVSAEDHARNLSGRLQQAATENERATRLIRTLCNKAPDSPGCLYPRCDCGTAEARSK